MTDPKKRARALINYALDNGRTEREVSPETFREICLLLDRGGEMYEILTYEAQPFWGYVPASYTRDHMLAYIARARTEPPSSYVLRLATTTKGQEIRVKRRADERAALASALPVTRTGEGLIFAQFCGLCAVIAALSWGLKIAMGW